MQKRNMSFDSYHVLAYSISMFRDSYGELNICLTFLHTKNLLRFFE